MLKKLKPYSQWLHKFLIYFPLFSPFYWFWYAHIRVIESYYNLSIRSIFTDYIIKRKDKFFVSISMFMTAIYLFIFMNYLHYFFSYFDLGIYGDYYFRMIAFLNEYKFYVFITLLFSFLITLIDYILFYKIFYEVKDKKPSERIKNRYRKKAINNNKVFLGIDKKSKKPLYMEEDEIQHASIVGTTGAGKTESVFIPNFYQNLLRNNGKYGGILVEPKGSLETFNKLNTLVNNHKNFNKKIKLVNLSDPINSYKYNPLINGNAIEIKDRIITSFDWSEEFYKSESVTNLSVVLQTIESLGKKVTFHDLEQIFNNEKQAERLHKLCDDPFVRRRFKTYILDDFKEMKKNSKMLISKIDQIAHSTLGRIVNTYNPDINLLDVYKENDIVYFLLPSQQSSELTSAFGKMLLMDLKSTSGFIESNENIEKHFFPVYIDEFSEFAVLDFAQWLSKARSSGFAISLGIQSLGDLKLIDESFATKVIDNTNNKYILGVNSTETAETFSGELGTETTMKHTDRLEKSLLKSSESDMGSIREVEEFLVHPNRLKDFERGEFLFFMKRPQKKFGVLDGDYIPDPKEKDILSYSVSPQKIISYDDTELLLDPIYYEYLMKDDLVDYSKEDMTYLYSLVNYLKNEFGKDADDDPDDSKITENIKSSNANDDSDKKKKIKSDDVLPMVADDNSKNDEDIDEHSTII